MPLIEMLPAGSIDGERRLALRFQTLDPTQVEHWNELIGIHPDRSFVHTAAWVEVLRSTYAHQPYYLAGWTGPTLAALLPLMEVSSPWTGKRGVSLPFIDSCPGLAEACVSHEALFKAALALGRQRSWKYLELRGWSEWPAHSTPSLCYYGHKLGLNQNEEEVFSQFKPGVRQAIRKAHREGVEIETSSSLDAIRSFHRLQCQTRQRHGLPPQPLQFFKNIFEHVLSRNMGFIALARWQGRPIAGAIFFCFNRKALFKYGAADHAFQHLRGTDLVMAEGIRRLCREGFEELDLGRSSDDNSGLRRFKRGFGAEEYRINYMKYSLAHAEFVVDRDRTSGWFTPIFRRLPLVVTRLVGRLCYPHLS